MITTQSRFVRITYFSSYFDSRPPQNIVFDLNNIRSIEDHRDLSKNQRDYNRMGRCQMTILLDDGHSITGYMKISEYEKFLNVFDNYLYNKSGLFFTKIYTEEDTEEDTEEHSQYSINE